ATPHREMGFIAAAVGPAVTGLRPIAELMFVNFVGVALDPIMNEGAYLRYMLGGQVSVPLVVKTAIGAVGMGTPNGGGSAAQHSGSMYSILTHVPGLKCVAPSDAYTAKGLLAAAIRDDDPVVYFSHRGLAATKGDVPEEPYTLPIGEARRLRAGRDVTLAGIARMTTVCLDAAARCWRPTRRAWTRSWRPPWPPCGSDGHRPQAAAPRRRHDRGHAGVLAAARRRRGDRRPTPVRARDRQGQLYRRGAGGRRAAA